jgi:NADH-quinone oxidoreductase subunit J
MLSTTSHGFILPFEVVSMLLLAAMIGCIVIAMRPTQPNSEINPIIDKE